MKRVSNQHGVAIVETLLILIILAIVGFTGWFVWHSKQSADKTLNNATNTAQGSTAAATKPTTVTTFAECKAAAGSVMQETFPEKCVTKDGKSFTDTSSTQQTYLDIKEWGLKVTLTSNISDAYYMVSGYDTSGKVADQIDLSLQSLATTQCKAGGWAPALYFRYTASDTDPVSGKHYVQTVGTAHHIGNYYYAFKDGEGVSKDSGCQSTNANQSKANVAAAAFKAALDTLQAD